MGSFILGEQWVIYAQNLRVNVFTKKLMKDENVIKFMKK